MESWKEAAMSFTGVASLDASIDKVLDGTVTGPAAGAAR